MHVTATTGEQRDGSGLDPDRSAGTHTSTPNDIDHACIDAVVEASGVLAAAGQSDLIWGHVSVRDPAGRGAWMKAAGWGLEEIDDERVVLVSRSGGVLAGDGPRHIEYPIHLEVLAARPDVGCVVHTHAAASTAFSALGVPLRPVSHEGTLFVPPDLARFDGTSGLIRTPELGAELALQLGPRNALLLPGHGVVVAGADVPTAVMSAVLLDRACRLQLTLEAAGGPRVWTSDEEALAKREMCWPPRQLEAGYRYLARRAAAGSPPATAPGPRTTRESPAGA
jgi:ribulose-5-phosphate 4-epimerase/fuculose-1-phosphate aldolase